MSGRDGCLTPRLGPFSPEVTPGSTVFSVSLTTTRDR